MVFRKFSWETSKKSSPNREIFMHAFLLANTCFECQVTNCAKKNYAMQWPTNDPKEANMGQKRNSSTIFSSTKTYRFISCKNNAKDINEQTNIQATFQHMS